MKIRLAHVFLVFSLAAAGIIFKISENNNSVKVENKTEQKTEQKEKSGNVSKKVISKPEDVFNKLSYLFMREVTLTGTLKVESHEIVTGPNAGEKTDVYVLVFDKPITIYTTPELREEMSDFNDVKDVQLHVSSVEKYDIFESHLNKRVTVSGKLGVSPTVHYHKDITLFENKIEQTSPDVERKLVNSQEDGKNRTAMMLFTGPDAQLYKSNKKMWGFFSQSEEFWAEVYCIIHVLKIDENYSAVAYTYIEAEPEYIDSQGYPILNYIPGEGVDSRVNIGYVPAVKGTEIVNSEKRIMKEYEIYPSVGISAFLNSKNAVKLEPEIEMSVKRNMRWLYDNAQ